MIFDHGLKPWFIVHAFWSNTMVFQTFSKFFLLPGRPILAYLIAIAHAFWSKIMIFQKFSKFSLLPDRPILAYLMDITHAFWSKIMIFQKAWAIVIK